MSNRKDHKILITGANGLLGKQLMCFLNENGYTKVFGLIRQKSKSDSFNYVQGDLSDLGSLEDALGDVYTVIHCAAIVSFDPRDKKILNTNNIEGTANLVNTCLNVGVKELIYISSVAALGKPSTINKLSDQVEINEDQKWIESSLNSNYAKSKFEGECEVWRGEAEGLKVAVLNPSVIIGEGNWDKSSSRLFKYVWDQNSFLTDGYINYVDVLDVVSCVDIVLSADKFGERFIANAGKVSYEKFFNSIADRFSKKAPHIKLSNFWIGILWKLEYLRSVLTSSKPLITKETSLSASSNYFFDNSKIKKELNFQFKTLDESLDRICHYYLSKNTLENK